MDHFVKSPLFGQNGLQKSAWWHPLILLKNQKLLKDVDRMSKMCIKVIQDYQLDYFGKKSTFFVKMASGNQPSDVSLILVTNQKLSNKVYRMSIIRIKVIIWDFLSM